MRHLPVGQLLRNDAGHLAAGGQDRIGDGAHQADVAAAVDQAQAVAGDALAQRRGAFDVDGLVAGIGAAVDADAFHLGGNGDWGMGNRKGGTATGECRGYGVGRGGPQTPTPGFRPASECC